MSVKFSRAIDRAIRFTDRLVKFLVAHPARTRAFVVAILALVAAVIPGLPVSLIDSAVAAFLALAAGEGAKAVSEKRAEPSEAGL